MNERPTKSRRDHLNITRTSSKSSQMATILSVPQDVLRSYILSVGALDRCTLFSCGFVCKLFRRLSPRVGRFDVCLSAVSSGYLSLFRWSQDLGYLHSSVSTSDIALLAAREGHVHILRWLHENGVSVTRQLCDAAMAAGQLETAAWLEGRVLALPVPQQRRQKRASWSTYRYE
jgi:hypothetical protein